MRLLTVIKIPRAYIYLTVTRRSIVGKILGVILLAVSVAAWGYLCGIDVLIDGGASTGKDFKGKRKK